MLYDCALPVSLKRKGVETASGKHITPRRRTTTPSPYIVHLSREQEISKTIPVAQRIDALAQELIIDDVVDDDTSAVQAPTASLHVTREDLAFQLRESDKNISITPIATSEHLPLHKVESILEPSQVPHEPISDLLFEELPEQDFDRSPEPAASLSAQEPAFTAHAWPSVEDWLGRLPRFLPTQVRYRAIVSFVVLSMIVVLPLQAMQSIVGATETRDDLTEIGNLAIEELERGAKAVESQRYDVAQSDFARASDRFTQAQDSLGDMHLAIAALVNLIPQTDRTYETVRGLVIAGKELSQAAALFAQAGEDIADHSSLNLTDKLNLLSSYIAAAQPHVQLANEALKNVDPELVPEEKRAQVTELIATAPSLEQSLNEFLTLSETLSFILGDDDQMRYLVSFQNNTELRATGGFTGSFAEMDLLNGAVESVYIPEGGTYDVQGQLSQFVEAPQPLSLINSRWEFHDANWFPDFPSSAKKMIDFYSKAGGPTVDGLVAINATLMPDLLQITGPIDMPEYGRTISAENFLFETQKIVEYEYVLYQEHDLDREQDAPKQFIGDLAPIVSERLQTADMKTLLAVADTLGTALLEKDIQVYFRDNDLQSHIEALGWSGSIKQTSGDYLMVVNSNLGGGKTDSVITQDITVDIQISEQGEVVNTVTITKEHHGLRETLFEGANNVDYLRLYVPRGSELIDAEGFEIPPAELFEASSVALEQDGDLTLMTAGWEHNPAYGVDMWEESGKTVFGSWMQTAPGEVETVTFSYRLPWRFDLSSSQTLMAAAKERLGLHDLERYSLLLQKQSGVETRQTSVFLHLPESLALLWGSHEGLTGSGVHLDNTQDVFVHFLLEQ